jgi:pyruvate kinase
LRELLKGYNSKVKIIVKIERHEAIKNLDEIISETDVVMIAR